MSEKSGHLFITFREFRNVLLEVIFNRPRSFMVVYVWLSKRLRAISYTRMLQKLRSLYTFPSLLAVETSRKQEACVFLFWYSAIRGRVSGR